MNQQKYAFLYSSSLFLSYLPLLMIDLNSFEKSNE